jgi:NitT/TauT family transport system ATP-binding protein
MMMEPAISVRGVSKVFGGFQALRDVDLDIRQGELHIFLGPSGCGKTTLMRMISGFEYPSSGRILHCGTPIEGPGPDRGLIFQEGVNFPWRTVRRNVEFGLEMKGMPKAERARVAQKFIDLVGLTEFASHYPSQISGGMKQKMALATALANDPEALLMDEPFGALDAQTRSVMQRELLRIWSETNKTIIFVTHSIREALLLGNRISLFKTRPGEIAKIYDLDEELGKPNVERDSTDRNLVDMEGEIYRVMRDGEH